MPQDEPKFEPRGTTFQDRIRSLALDCQQHFDELERVNLRRIEVLKERLKVEESDQ